MARGGLAATLLLLAVAASCVPAGLACSGFTFGNVNAEVGTNYNFGADPLIYPDLTNTLPVRGWRRATAATAARPARSPAEHCFSL